MSVTMLATIVGMIIMIVITILGGSNGNGSL